MNRVIVAIVLIISLTPVANSTRYGWDLTTINLRDVVLGIVLTSADGEYIEDGQEMAVIQSISEYFASEFDAHGIQQSVRIDTYFPWACSVPGLKLSRYQPVSEDGITRRIQIPGPGKPPDLYLIVSGALTEKGETHSGLTYCAIGADRLDIIWPKDWPSSMWDKSKYTCGRSEDLAEDILCPVKRQIDMIVYALSLKHGKPTK